MFYKDDPGNHTPLPAYSLNKLLAAVTATIDYSPGGVRVAYGNGRIAVYEDRDEMYRAMEARIEAWAAATGLAPIVAVDHKDTVEVDEGVCVEEITLYTITVGAKASLLAGSIYVVVVDMKAETRGCRTQRTLTPIQLTLERRPLPDADLTPKAHRAMMRMEWSSLAPVEEEQARDTIVALAVHELYGEETSYIASLRRQARHNRVHGMVAEALSAQPP